MKHPSSGVILSTMSTNQRPVVERPAEKAGTDYNIPDRFELFILPPGMKKATEEPDTRKLCLFYNPTIIQVLSSWALSRFSTRSNQTFLLGVPSTSIFTFNREDHTLANVLRSRLLHNRHVLFAAYKVPHPSDPYVNDPYYHQVKLHPSQLFFIKPRLPSTIAFSIILTFQFTYPLIVYPSIIFIDLTVLFFIFASLIQHLQALLPAHPHFVQPTLHKSSLILRSPTNEPISMFFLRCQTDGTITPRQAVIQASKESVQDYGLLSQEFLKEWELRKMVGESSSSAANGNAAVDGGNDDAK